MSRESEDMFNKGCCYYYGRDDHPLDYNKAFECFNNAAELGDSNAMNYVGVMYEYGEGVEKNTAIAADWYYKAIQANNANAYAAYNLANLYFNGDGLPKDMVKAFEFFKMAADLDSEGKTKIYADACFKSGYIAMEFYKNKGVAVRYFKKAALHGNTPAAWHNLGLLCEQGAMNLRREKIPGAAYQYYERAANAGMPESMYNAGRMCMLAGMEDEAKEWMRKSADKGFAPAKKWLKLDRITNGGSLWSLFS